MLGKVAIGAAAGLAVFAGAAADGYADTKYAFNADGSQRAIFGMSPGMAGSVGVGVVGLTGIFGSWSAVLIALAVGGLAGEVMKYSANRTASAMSAQQGTQGVAGFMHGAPQNSNALPRNGMNGSDLETMFARLEGLRRPIAA